MDFSAKIYKEFQELVNSVEEKVRGYSRNYQIPDNHTEELKVQLMHLKEMYELGKSKNMGKLNVFLMKSYSLKCEVLPHIW